MGTECLENLCRHICNKRKREVYSTLPIVNCLMQEKARSCGSVVTSYPTNARERGREEIGTRRMAKLDLLMVQQGKELLYNFMIELEVTKQTLHSQDSGEN